MISKQTKSAAVSVLITFLTSLGVLLTAEGVVSLSDVTPVSYIVAGIGAAIVGLKDIQSRKAPPE